MPIPCECRVHQCPTGSPYGSSTRGCAHGPEGENAGHRRVTECAACYDTIAKRTFSYPSARRRGAASDDQLSFEHWRAFCAALFQMSDDVLRYFLTHSAAWDT